MPAFVFKLRPLLKARCRAEEAEQRAVAALERQRLDLEGALRRRQNEIVEEKHTLRGSLTGRVDMRNLRLRAGMSLHLVRQAQQLVLQLAGLHKRIDAARARLIEATRRRRAIELLRDRRFEQWKASLDKAETAALDELAVAAAARKEGELHPMSMNPTISAEASP